MVGNERYDYLVLCDTDLANANIYDGALTYSSFSECVAACSIADQQFDSPVCRGVAFDTTASGAGNCFLKGDSSSPVIAQGVDSALLQRIAVGVSNNDFYGSTTEALSFAGASATTDSSAFNSMMSSVLANSTENMPMVTPRGGPAASGRQVAAITAFSMYVSEGSTYSTGQGFSTNITNANGGFHWTYYSSYYLSWASATTIYGYSESGVTPQNGTISSTSSNTYPDDSTIVTTVTNSTTFTPEGYDVTQVTSEETYDQNHSLITSTATTNHYSYQTAVAGSGNGGSGGAAGSPASTSAGPLITSTISSGGGNVNGGNGAGGAGGAGNGGPSTSSPSPSYSIVTVISTNGGTAGATGGGGSGGPPTTQTFVYTIISNGSTAYSTSYLVVGSTLR